MTDLPEKAVVNVSVLDDPETRGPDSAWGAPMKLPDMETGDLSIYNGKSTCLRFCQDGRVYVNDTLVDTDLEVYNGIRKLLGLQPKGETEP